MIPFKNTSMCYRESGLKIPEGTIFKHSISSVLYSEAKRKDRRLQRVLVYNVAYLVKHLIYESMYSGFVGTDIPYTLL